MTHGDAHEPANARLDTEAAEPVLLPSPLLIITDRHRATAPLTTVIAESVHGGARWIRIREPDLGLFEYVSLCHLLMHAEAGSRVVWSVRPHAYAMLRTAHPDARLAVHLTETDHTWAAPDASVLVGRSVHRETRARDAATEHESLEHTAIERNTFEDSGYRLLAPVFDTACKPDAFPLGLAALSAYVNRSALPVIALGGVSVERVASCREAGAAAVAVCGGIMEAAEPAAAVRAFLNAWST